MPLSTARIAILLVVGALVLWRAIALLWPAQSGSGVAGEKANSQNISLRLSWLTLATAVLASLAVGRNAPDQSNTAPAVASTRAVAQTIAVSGYPRVISGDVMIIQGRRIRLFGIDAPDGKQTCKNADDQNYDCGWKATVALVDHIAGGTVSCRPRGIDRFRRTLAVCHLGAEDLNAWMVAQGWAVAYRHHSRDYVLQQYMAKMDRLGIWAGSFAMPWEWRQQR
jgi:endonuclease YncB( thermonuclease family)